MSVTIVFPRALLPYAQGKTDACVDEPCATVGEALAALSVRMPAVVDRVLTEQGEIREHVNVFVGEDSVRFMGGLNAPVPDGSTILIVPAVSGG